jgi:3-mercaptopropionate dioxygenase
MSDRKRLLAFIAEMTRLVSREHNQEPDLLPLAKELMRELVSKDDWLPDELARSHERYYQQHLIYGDPLDRFSLVSFVWGPGQRTPVHNHRVWGVIGMLRGREYAQRYTRGIAELAAVGEEVSLEPGNVDVVSPSIGDIHRVRNAYDDRVSISIHLYGGNIGKISRSVFDLETDCVKPFVSGYSNSMMPNLWWSAQP